MIPGGEFCRPDGAWPYLLTLTPDSASLHPGLLSAAPYGAEYVALGVRCVLTQQPERGVRNQVRLGVFAAWPQSP